MSSDLFSFQVQKRRKHCEERVGCSILKLHSPADKPGDGTSAAGANYPVIVLSMSLDQLCEVDCRGRGRVAQRRPATYSPGKAGRPVCSRCFDELAASLALCSLPRCSSLKRLNEIIDAACFTGRSMTVANTGQHSSSNADHWPHPTADVNLLLSSW